MSCGPNVFSIFQGDAKAMSLQAVYDKAGANPLDLTDCTEIVINLPGPDGAVPLKLSLADITITSPAVLGNFVATADAIGDVSALLNIGVLQSFSVEFTIDDSQLTVPYLNCLSVFQAP